jgi:hypothetical protein
MFQKAIASQNPKMSREQRVELRNNKGHEMTFKRYHRYSGTWGYKLFLIAVLTDLITLNNKKLWLQTGKFPILCDL